MKRLLTMFLVITLLSSAQLQGRPAKGNETHRLDVAIDARTLRRHDDINPFASVPSVPPAGNSVLEAPAAVTKSRAQESYGKLPLSFEANQGQTDGRVKFLARGSGYDLFLTAAETQLRLELGAVNARSEFNEAPAARSSGPAGRTSALLRMKYVGAQRAARVSGINEMPGKSSYLIGNDPAKWHTNIPSYAKVKYEGLYPGIDLIYYGNQSLLEYDFVVAPGADPGRIKLAFTGASRVRIDPRGDLVLRLAGREIRQRRPTVYQQVAGARKEVAGRYVRKGKQVSFALGRYDASLPLIIDPILAYSTYLGGTGIDQGLGIAVDSSGSAYVTGLTGSVDWPITAGTLDPTFSGGDAFVAKLDATGSTLLYSTYLGGSNFELGFGIAVDNQGNAYLTGRTNSPDFPTTTDAFDLTFNGGSEDAFVTKLNPNGSAFIYSTYLGGSASDQGLRIAADSTGNAYVTGFTLSADFPTTAGAFDTSSNGDRDAFVVKLDATGAALDYSTYFGGAGLDQGLGIAVDSSGSAYVAGGTSSSNLPTTAGAFDTTFNGDRDIFLTKLDAAGAALIYSTYLGGSGFEQGPLALDSQGNAYVTGITRSPDFPTTAGAFDTTFNGGDVFVTKLDATGSALLYSTYFGGNGDGGSAIAVDSGGNAYVTGTAFSAAFPTTAGAFDATFNGGLDAFFTKLNASGSALLYSTYLGGSGLDQGAGIAVDSQSNAYLTGTTGSITFPTTPCAFDTSQAALDVFVVKFQSVDDLNGNGIPDDQEDCSVTPTPEPDSDGDGVSDGHDNCPLRPNPDQADSDADGVGDVCDNCRTTPNPAQTDSDLDGVGDVCDNCPNSFNPAQRDTNEDGVGDVCTRFSFPTNGYFVIGDQVDLTGGATVYFWGAQWAQHNAMTFGPGSHAFKGFTNGTVPPQPGGRWTSRSGDDSAPPDRVPSFMGVVVTASARKDGSVITGDVGMVVVIQPDHGYGPSPGQIGTGKVVAVIGGPP